jgi:hypothetical protein
MCESVHDDIQTYKHHLIFSIFHNIIQWDFILINAISMLYLILFK